MMRIGTIRIAIMSITIFTLMAGFLLRLIPVEQAGATTIPRIFNYQAKLTNNLGVTVANGTQNAAFVLYDAATGGNCLWSAANTDANIATIDCGAPGQIATTITSGVFSVLLGDTTGGTQNTVPDIADTVTTLYLGVRVGTDAEMTPRKRIVSALLATEAADADLLDGFNSTQAGAASSVVVTNAAQNIIFGTTNTGVDTIGGILLIGGTASGSAGSTVSICNSANCDTVTLGTNADADTITIGEALDDISITDAQWSITALGAAAFASLNGTPIGATTPGTGAFTTLSSTGVTALGNNSATVAIDSSSWDISTLGVASGLTGITSSGTIALSGLTTNGPVIATGGTGTLATEAQLAVARGGTGAATFTTNGVLFGNGTNGVQVTAVGGAGSLCLVSTNGGAPVFSSCAGGGASTVWSSITAPTVALSLNHAEFATTFTWDSGTTAATLDGLTIAFTNDATTDANVQRLFVLQNNDAAGATATERLLVLNNADTDEVVTTALEVAAAAGAITTAIDVSDAEIGTALAFGANDIDGTNFDVTGATGNIITGGDAAVNGGDLTTTAVTFNLVNATATTVNFAGAATTLAIGAGTGTSTVNNALTITGTTTTNGALTANGAVSMNDASADTILIGQNGGTADTVTIAGDTSITDTQWSVTAAGAATFASVAATTTGATLMSGNLDMGNNLVLNIGAAATDFTVTGGLALADDLAVNGGDLTTTAVTFNLVNATATTVNFAGAATTLAIGAGTGTSTVNNALTITGITTTNGTLTANGVVTLGDNGDTVAVNSSDWDITTAGAVTGLASIATDDNQSTLVTNIPVTGTDAIAHTISLQIDGNTGISIAATGDGAGVVGVRTIQAGVSAAADIVTIGDANADVSITDANWSVTAAGAATFASVAATTTGATLMSGNLDMGNNLVLNIGAAATDFTVTGGLALADDLAVNGGDLTTTAVTFNLVNATATTVNFAGAATTLAIGAGTGTSTVNNALTITGITTTNGALTANGAVSMNDASADTILIGQNGGTADTVTIAGDTSITDTQWSVTAAGAATFATVASGATTLSGALDMGNNLITNIGAAATDFTAGGGLTLDEILVVNDDTDINLAAGENLTIAATAAPTANLVSITNTGQGVTTTGLSALNVFYTQAINAAAQTNRAIEAQIRTTTDDAADTADGFGLFIANESTAGTQNGLVIGNLASTANGATEVLISLDNAEDVGAVADGILIASSGAGGITDAIDINSGTIGTALAIRSTGVTTDIRLQNGEVIQNDADGTIAFTDGTNTLMTIVDAGTTGTANITGGTLSTSAVTFNLVNATATTVNFAGAATTTLNIGSTTTGANVFAADVDMNFSGAENLVVTGTAPTDTTDVVRITNTASANSYDLVQLTPIVPTADTGLDTVNALHVTLAAPTEAFDTVRGIQIDGAAITSGTQVGLNFGAIAGGVLNGQAIFVNSGWDTGIVLGSAITEMQWTGDATNLWMIDDGANLTISDASVNSLITITDAGTTGNLAVSGDVAVNGGDLTTTAAAFNLVNATATTVNFASAATTLNINDAAVTSTIDIGGVDSSGTNTINIATNATAADTITIGNTTAGTTTTLRGGAASVIDFTDFDVAATGRTTITPDSDVSALVIDGSNITSSAMAFDLSANTLTGGSAFRLLAGNTNTANNGFLGTRFGFTNSQSTAASSTITGLQIDWSQTSSVAGNTESVVSIFNQPGTSSGDTVVDALLVLDNRDTATTPISVTDAIQIQVSGNQAGGIVNAIAIRDSDVTNDILLQNGEIIHNNTDGTIAFTDGTNTLVSIVDQGTTGDLTVSGDAAVNGGDLTTTATTFNLVNATATTVNFAGGATTTLNIGSTTTGTSAFAADLNMTFVATENLAITSDVNTTSTIYPIDMTITTGGGTPGVGQEKGGIRITNANGAGGVGTGIGTFLDLVHADDQLLSAGITIVSTNASGTMNDGIIIASTAGAAITDGIDVSDDDFVNAISVGANTILGTTATIDFTSFDVTGAGAVTIGGTLAANGVVTIGDGGDTVAINSFDWDISTTGELSGIAHVLSDNNQDTLFIDMPVTGTDSILHTVGFEIDGNVGISVAATGNGAGAVGARTITVGATAAADIITIGDGNADVSITDAQWSISAAGAASFVIPTSLSTERLCWDNAGASLIQDCDGTPGDYAELYGTQDPQIGAGDLVVIDEERGATEIEKDGQLGSRAWVIKSSGPYQSTLIGVISTNPNEVIGENFEAHENPRPVALSGRVPVRVTDENGTILPGDYLTSSSTPGHAMKATEPGRVIGMALGFVGGAGEGKLIMQVMNGWFNGLGVEEADNQASGATSGLATLDFSNGINMNGGTISGIGRLLSQSGSWSIDESGRIAVVAVDTQELTTETLTVRVTDGRQAVGEGRIPEGAQILRVNNELVAAATKVFVTFRSRVPSGWWISGVGSGWFEISLDTPLTNGEIAFDYWIVGVEDARQPVVVEPLSPPSPQPSPIEGEGTIGIEVEPLIEEPEAQPQESEAGLQEAGLPASPSPPPSPLEGEGASSE